MHEAQTGISGSPAAGTAQEALFTGLTESLTGRNLQQTPEARDATMCGQHVQNINRHCACLDSGTAATPCPWAFLRVASAAARRAGEAPSTALTEVLTGLGFEMDRLKTGTPARVDSRTVNFASLEAQPGDPDVRWFSFDRSVSTPPFSEGDAFGMSVVCKASAEGRSTF